MKQPRSALPSRAMCLRIGRARRKGKVRGMPPAGFRYLLVSLLATFALFGCNTGDECSQGEARCDQGVAMNCVSVSDEPSSGMQWSRVACKAPRTCAIDNHSAFCALGKSDLCSGDTQVCDGTDLLQCNGSWYTARFPCESCDASQNNSCQRGVNTSCTKDSDCMNGYLCFGAQGGRGECAYSGCPNSVCTACDTEASSDGGVRKACFF